MNIFSRRDPDEGKHRIYNLIILDESGSMQSLKDATLEGLHSVFDTIREGMEKFSNQVHSISLVSFSSNRIKNIIWNEPVKKIPSDFGAKYRPAGSTPLYDAIGMSLKKLRNELKGQSEQSYNVLVTILTDGQENSSQEFSFNEIRTLIGELQAGPWTFAFIGASLDAYNVAKDMNIQNAMHFAPTPDGLANLFQMTKAANFKYMKAIYLEKDDWEWKENFFEDSNLEDSEKKTEK